MTEKVTEIDLYHTLQHNTHDIYYYSLESQDIQNRLAGVFYQKKIS